MEDFSQRELCQLGLYNKDLVSDKIVVSNPWWHKKDFINKDFVRESYQ